MYIEMPIFKAETLMMNVQPRPYRDEQDLNRMKALLVAGRAAGGPTYYVHVGDLDWWLRYLNQGDDLRQVLYLWDGQRRGADLVGWSLLSPRVRAFDVFVHPEEGCTERAEQIWAWTEGRMIELVREQGGDDVRTMWVSGHDAILIALLEHRGFARSDYHLIYMTRSLDEPIPEPVLPPGYHLRHVAGTHEVAQRAAVSHAAFGSSLPLDRYRERYLQFMRSSAYTPELDLVVAAPDGRFGAFCMCWLDNVNRVGLFEPLGTGPDFRRQGLGTAVLCEGLRRMRERGMTIAMVCVEHDNPAAQRLYSSVGFHALHRIFTFAKKV
jgi:ribosomal protein S18 acetylase RimI-like enzyme